MGRDSLTQSPKSRTEKVLAWYVGTCHTYDFGVVATQDDANAYVAILEELHREGLISFADREVVASAPIERFPFRWYHEDAGY